MQTWFTPRTSKFAFGWGLVLACVAACGCWNSNPNRSTINSSRPLGLRNRADSNQPGTPNNPAGTNLNANTPANLNNGLPANSRVSGSVPGVTNRIGMHTPVMNTPNNGIPPQFGEVRPAGGAMPGANNNGLTPIASNNVANSPRVDLPVSLNNMNSLPAPDPTPGAAAPPVVSMQDQDPVLNRRVPPPIPASELPPTLNGSSGIQTPPGSPVRTIR